MVRYLIVGLILASLAAVTGCNTLAGASQDTKETFNAATGTPPSSAYHQEARDF